MVSKPIARQDWATADTPWGVLSARSCASPGTWRCIGHVGNEKPSHMSLLDRHGLPGIDS